MRIAIAGGSGFIGRHVAETLRAAGHDVLVVSRTTGVTHDLGAGPLPSGALAECDAVVNLVGIKAEAAENTFERAHVRAVAHLIASAQADGVTRIVHVSVATSMGAENLPYFTSKRRGESLVRASDLSWSILRPTPIYGEGDELARNLVQLVRFAPIFPAPRAGRAPLPIVDVRDVATAVLRCLEREASIGRTYDIVGPEPITFRTVIDRVAEGLGLRIHVVAVPLVLQRATARVMEVLLPRPLVVRSQVEMLAGGMTGDPAPARDDLGLHPRALTPERVAELAAKMPSAVPSLRLVPSAEHRRWLDAGAKSSSTIARLLPIVMVAMLVTPAGFTDTWSRMATVEIAAAGLALAFVRVPWRELVRPTIRGVSTGLAAAIGLYLAGAGSVTLLLALSPELATHIRAPYALFAGHSLAFMLAVLPIVVAAEDVFWRGAVTLALAGRLGAVSACALAAAAFALAHVTSGPPMLWAAALCCGFVWSWLTVRTRSLVPTFVCHLTWDGLVMFVAPY